YAYAPGNGDVYYRVGKFEGYGKLSRRKVEDLRIGARIEPGESKQDPLDFVLWKAAKPGEPSWSSPWGDGRPGWHIECSVMSTCCLGDSFDIHGGGNDLEFPHHENEIAQSEAATGKPYAKSWLHCGMITINGEKMSKSLGNFFTIREVLEKYHPEVVRYLLIASHYRSPINYSEDNLRESKAALERFYNALKGLPEAEPAAADEFVARFSAAMDDDFNTASACSVLFELAREVNRLRDSDIQAAAALAARLKSLAALLGVLQLEPEAFLQADAAGRVDAAAVEALIEARLAARAAKDWAASDQIRDQLSAMGVLLEDAKGVTTWRLAD
ncbi:MAG: cysteine--tRNA ligase, partial [Pseudomonadaceae bacterium]|nr:cysteine--tRNA ligase [Pseudomonadaceae bacterium]